MRKDLELVVTVACSEPDKSPLGTKVISKNPVSFLPEGKVSYTFYASFFFPSPIAIKEPRQHGKVPQILKCIPYVLWTSHLAVGTETAFMQARAYAWVPWSELR